MADMDPTSRWAKSIRDPYDAGLSSEVQNGTIKTTVNPGVAGDQPDNQAGGNPVGSNSSLRRPVAGVQSGPSGASLTKDFMPGTRALLRGNAEDMEEQIGRGRYGGAAGTLMRNTFGGLPLAIADDVVGAPIRTLRQPAADFGRSMLGMQERKEPTAAAPAPSPVVAAIPAEDPRVRFYKAGSAEAIAASKKIDSGGAYIPGYGRGMLRNSSGNVTEFNSGPDRSAPPSQETLRRAYAPTDYSHEDAVRSAPTPGSGPKGWVDEVVANKNARAAADRAVLLRGHDITSRGQDLSYDSAMTGHLMGQKAAQAKLRWEQAKDARDTGFARSDKNFEQRKVREEQIDKQLEGRFVNPETGKTDPQQAYEYKQFMQNGLADAAKQLMASKDPQQQALGKALQGRSYADLDPQDMQGLEQAWQLRGQMKEGAGVLFGQWFMNKGRFVDSLRPQDFVPNGEEERTLGGNHITTRNGSGVSVNDLRDSTLGVFPSGTNRFEDQIRQAKKAQSLREGQ